MVSGGSLGGLGRGLRKVSGEGLGLPRGRRRVENRRVTDPSFRVFFVSVAANFVLSSLWNFSWKCDHESRTWPIQRARLDFSGVVFCPRRSDRLYGEIRRDKTQRIVHPFTIFIIDRSQGPEYHDIDIDIETLIGKLTEYQKGTDCYIRYVVLVLTSKFDEANKDEASKIALQETKLILHCSITRKIRIMRTGTFITLILLLICILLSNEDWSKMLKKDTKEERRVVFFAVVNLMTELQKSNPHDATNSRQLPFKAKW